MHKPSIFGFIVTIVVMMMLLNACGGNQSANTINSKMNEPATQPGDNSQTGDSTSELPAAGQVTPMPALEVGSTFQRTTDGMLMVYVPAGNFTMGMAADAAFTVCQNFPTPCSKDWFVNAEPEHTVNLDAYWIDKTEVTNAMFAGFVSATGYQTEGEKSGKGWAHSGSKFIEMSGVTWKTPHGAGSSIDGLENHPVVAVTQADAIAYCKWAGARLPTEAEWEKAARGTDGRLYPWGNQQPDASLANFADTNASLPWADKNVNDGYEFTAPVGTFAAGASPYGALDMAGNAWEWVSDWFSATYYSESPSSNPQGPASGSALINRGGGWTDHAASLFSIYRAVATAAYYVNDFSGFRCASSLP